jgi:hypothetical protein
MSGLSAFTFVQQITLDLVGPVTTAIVGGALVAGLAGVITRKAQQRRAHRELREQLIAEATRIAATLYMATQQFWRARDFLNLPDEQLQPIRASLDAQYLASRVDGTVLENRLEAYYAEDTPRRLAHQMMDLLTVRYFQLAFPARTPYSQNAGPLHSGLNEAQLKKPPVVLATYHRVQNELCHALLRVPLEAPA